MVEEKTAVKAKSASPSTKKNTPRPIDEIGAETEDRIPSDISELDGVLGGGLVAGSVLLLGGEPGIGKSTLLLMAAHHYSKSTGIVLYVSAEESESQIALRAERLGVQSKSLFLVSENSIQAIMEHIDALQPKILIIDSIQTVQSAELESQAGTVGQLRECTFALANLSKARGISTFLVGHVTKEGNIAGPKLLEHMVDVVLYFESSTSHSLRLLRSMKNRFGSTHEVGVFEMCSEGLRQITNPSSLFLSEHNNGSPGSVITANLEGSRPLLLEVQSLVCTSYLPVPRRTSIGIDPNRVTLMAAILEKRGGFHLSDQDIYVNLAGGIKVHETATDLAVAAAMISSIANRPIDAESVFFGEIGLGGEVRSIPKVDIRLNEAKRLGFKTVYLPAKSVESIQAPPGLKLVPIKHIQQLNDI